MAQAVEVPVHTGVNLNPRFHGLRAQVGAFGNLDFGLLFDELDLRHRRDPCTKGRWWVPDSWHSAAAIVQTAAIRASGPASVEALIGITLETHRRVSGTSPWFGWHTSATAISPP